MEKTRLIAITGGIGSGKSLALSLIKESGYFTLSCDEIVNEIYSKRCFLIKLKKLFGKDVCVINKSINRNEISKKVFSDSALREKLNRLVHPQVVAQIYKKVKRAKVKTAVVEVPLLFESNLQTLFDKVLIIVRDKNSREKALLERGLNKEQIIERINSQIDYENLDKTPYTAILNDSDENSLKQKLIKEL